MSKKIRYKEDVITTLDDRDNIELYMFEDNDPCLDTLQSALKESQPNKNRDGGA